LPGSSALCEGEKEQVNELKKTNMGQRRGAEWSGLSPGESGLGEGHSLACKVIVMHSYGG
jgi:hypothetical protein